MTLIDFYGENCSHCRDMEPKLKQLEKDTGVKVVRKEVYNNEANAKAMQEASKGRCMGLPMLYNTETDDVVCIKADMARLKKWAGK